MKLLRLTTSLKFIFKNDFIRYAQFTSSNRKLFEFNLKISLNLKKTLQ